MIDDIKVREDMVELHNLILSKDFYVDLYIAVLMDSAVDEQMLLDKQVSADNIIKIANKFWMHLPDSSAIRREPFYHLCNIAELCFDEDFGDDE